MSYKESDIIHEAGAYWVLKNSRERKSHDVMRVCGVVSETVHSFEFNEDGKSIAIAYCDYLSRRNSGNKASDGINGSRPGIRESAYSSRRQD